MVSNKYLYEKLSAENIYNLIVRPPEISKKDELRYQSIHKETTKEFYDSKKKPHQTMGFAKTPLSKPNEYLKKYARKKDAKKGDCKFTCLTLDHRLPPVPKHDAAPPVVFDEPKNFVALNSLAVRRKPALWPAKKWAHTRIGDTFLLEFSGLMPKFCMKKGFGTTPRYLVQRKADLSRGDELLKKSMEPQNMMKKLSPEERNDLLEGLRESKTELYKKYMSLPLLIDSDQKRKRKGDMEKQLDILNHDIYFLEKHAENDIYILPD